MQAIEYSSPASVTMSCLIALPLCAAVINPAPK